MSLLQTLLHLTNFKSPLLQTLIPTVAVSYAIQAGVAVPSVIAQSERFYDISGSVTFLTCTALSLYLPALRARAMNADSKAALPSLLSAFTKKSDAGVGALNWRQVVLSACVTIWATRLGSYLLQRILRDGTDSRFDKIKQSPPAFFGAFMAQASWVALSLLPVVAVNAVAPSSVLARALGIVKVSDVIGLSAFAVGLALEVAADRQKAAWVRQKKSKQHDEEFITRGLWSRSQYPNYFGESLLWTGIATAAAGVVLARPIRVALGVGPKMALAMCYASPAFVTFLLLKVSGVPMSEKKYDKRYGDRADYRAWKEGTPKFFPKLF